jgi:hypothetical protein
MRTTLTLWILVSFGCSAADGSGSGARSSMPNASGVKGNAGAGGASSSNPVDGFGNPTGNPTGNRPPQAMVDGGACTEGFCGPTNPDGDCGSFIVKTDVEVTVNPGNLLVIFDESASMVERWPATGTDKLSAAREALTTALMPLQDLLTVGALFFPTTACILGPAIDIASGNPIPAVAALDSPVQIPFMKGPEFLGAWAQHWMNLPPAGLPVGTPVNEAFDQAAIALDAALKNGTITGATIVALFTDGAPTCAANEMLTGLPNKPEIEHAREWLASHDIKTYVVGLPGADGVQLLNDIAVNGGTTGYILPQDTADLEMKLRSAVEETVKRGLNSCTISLDPPPSAPEKLHLVVFETSDPTKGFDVDRNLSDDAGWTLSADSTKVELTGRLCEDALAGRFDKVTFQYGCVDVPPLPPPPPVL